METISLVTKSGLLHDIGKVCHRAKRERDSHPSLGTIFLSSFIKETEAEKQLLRCVKYHHHGDLKSAKLSDDDLAYIVYEADNIASGADRRRLQEHSSGGAFKINAPLQNIFDIFGKAGDSSCFLLKGIDADEGPIYPVKGTESVSQESYEQILSQMESNFSKKSPLAMTDNELLRILEDLLPLVPSSTDIKDAVDISLYDHSKITAALGAAMLSYFEEKGITNYKEACFDRKNENRKEEMFCLISGDFSGIQKFIYRIKSEGALRMLRGRSFYLDLMLEHMADEILEALQLSRANLIYCSGGHFYILAANTEKTKSVVDRAWRTFNEWLVKTYSGVLYLAMASVPFCADDIQGKSDTGRDRNIFRRASEALGAAKVKRFPAEFAQQLFDETSEINRTLPGGRECHECHRSCEALHPMKEGSEMEVCDTCRGLYQFGKALLDDTTLFAVTDSRGDERAVPLPALEGSACVIPVTLEELETLHGQNVLCRVYDRNQSRTSELIGTRLMVADYAFRDDYSRIADFSDLAELSGDEKGIRRLGVLRADVDSLGSAFIAGFVKPDEEEPERFGTLSRYAALSRNIAWFFRKILKDVAEKKFVVTP